MELLFVTLIAFCIGLLARYTLPGRDTYGVVLIPSIAAIGTAVAWEILLWVGWKFDGGWIWVVSLGVSVVISLVLALVIPRRRHSSDAQLLEKLSRA